MKIQDKHKYHGSALIQVAEHKRFTAINALKTGAKLHRNAYKINDQIGLFLKYASTKTSAHNEYSFVFTNQHLNDLKKIHEENTNTFIAMVCVGDRQICCLSYDELTKLIASRKAKKGCKEDQYAILVTVPHGKSMRVYVNAPGVKNTWLGKQMIVKRNEFPDKIFG